MAETAVAPARPRQKQVEVRPATRADVPQLSQVLARAFDDDPFLNWFVRQDGKRDQRFEKAFQIALGKMSNGLNETYTTTGLEAGALWKRPNEYKIGFGQTLGLVMPYAGITGWSSLLPFIKATSYIEERHEHHVPEPHYYLFVLGVEPSLQGQGVGGQIMQPVLDICDREGKPAYLETATERNVTFYQKHGFKVVEEVNPPPNCPLIWLMRREPRQG